MYLVLRQYVSSFVTKTMLVAVNAMGYKHNWLKLKSYQLNEKMRPIWFFASELSLSVYTTQRNRKLHSKLYEHLRLLQG